MTTTVLRLPLYTSPCYSYTTTLQETAYKIRFNFNERMSCWIMDIYLADGTPVVLGEAVVGNYPMFMDYAIPNLPGAFVFLPIGADMNETYIRRIDMANYYNLFYAFEE